MKSEVYAQISKTPIHILFDAVTDSLSSYVLRQGRTFWLYAYVLLDSFRQF